MLPDLSVTCGVVSGTDVKNWDGRVRDGDWEHAQNCPVCKVSTSHRWSWTDTHFIRTCQVCGNEIIKAIAGRPFNG